MNKNKPTPEDLLEALILASNSGKVADMPSVGSFAKKYADSIAEEINGENVNGYIHGAATINLLVQEAILRATKGAAELRQDAEGEQAGTAYAQGCSDGALLIARLIAPVVDGLVRGVIEGPAYDREFDSIINQF